MKKKTDQFKTKDLYIASYLYAVGVKFVGLAREGRVCRFVFEDFVSAERGQQDFLSKDGVVVAKDYVDALRTLKDLIFGD